MEPVTVTVEAARRALGLGLTKTWELIGNGQLQSVKIGRRTLVTTESIRSLVASSTQARAA